MASCRCCRRYALLAAEILLCADGEPWLAGRTVVPESTLSGPELALQSWGKRRWGVIFSPRLTLTRDFIEIGRDAAVGASFPPSPER
jgi:chorismate--pyruvate lyase